MIPDLTAAFLNPFDLPCCPLCDNAMQVTDEVQMVAAHGCLILVHVACRVEAES